MGAFLLTAGTKGKRFSMPNARIMIHQPLGGASGQAVDIEIQAKEIMYHKANLNGIMAECTGQPIDQVSSLRSSSALSFCSLTCKFACLVTSCASGSAHPRWQFEQSETVLDLVSPASAETLQQ